MDFELFWRLFGLIVFFAVFFIVLFEWLLFVVIILFLVVWFGGVFGCGWLSVSFFDALLNLSCCYCCAAAVSIGHLGFYFIL